MFVECSACVCLLLFVVAVPQVVHITPHGGVAPPMPSQSQSGQAQQQQTPQQPTSSGHQTPTPSQHTAYAVQQVGPGVGVMPSAAGTPPQTHLYHAMTQHPVITPQGPAPPSPQVCRFLQYVAIVKCSMHTKKLMLLSTCVSWYPHLRMQDFVRA